MVLACTTSLIYVMNELYKIYSAGGKYFRRLLEQMWVIKSRRLRLAGHLARMEEGRSAFKILTGDSFYTKNSHDTFRIALFSLKGSDFQ